MGKRPTVIQFTLHQYLHSATGRLAAIQARPNHSGIVEDQKVPRQKHIEKIGKLKVLKDAGVAVEG